MTMKETLALALMVPFVMTAAPALAQEQVTIVTRDGERVSGRFEDWDRQTDTVYVRVSLHDQRKLPMADLRLIAVGGPAEGLPSRETDAASGPDHVLVTRGGEVLRGRLTNIEGGEGSADEDEPRTVTFQANGERRFRMDEVSRIYLGHYQPATSADSATRDEVAQVPPGSVRVPANQQWTATGITVRKGDRVQFSTTGEVQLSTAGDDKASSAGSLKGRRAEGSPAPQYLAGALIGRIGNGQPFAIGDQTTPLPMPGTGQLYLGINDDHVSDNTGAFIVRAQVERE